MVQLAHHRGDVTKRPTLRGLWRKGCCQAARPRFSRGAREPRRQGGGLKTQATSAIKTRDTAHQLRTDFLHLFGALFSF